MTLLTPFKPLFRQPTWIKVQILFIGAILATGKRTVTAALRVMGLSDEPHFANYHQVLNRAVWSPRRLSEMLLALLMKYLDRDETKPLVFGIDETIERRWGAADSQTRHIPGCGALKQKPLRQNQRFALDQLDVADGNTVGRTDLGLTLSNRLGSIRTVS
jgi:hypothetical protein